MKLLEWQNFLAAQREQHGKVIFSVAELANAADTTPHTLNVELARLRARGVLKRYAQGRYGPAAGVGPEQLLPALDPDAYITGFYALLQHHLVTQVPSEITCFTTRRHNQVSHRSNPAGNFRFIRVSATIYAKPRQGLFAPPEQALCDFFYLNLRAGTDPRHLVTFRKLQTLNRPRLRKILNRYPAAVRNSVETSVNI